MGFLASELRKQQYGLDPAVRRVTIKFSQLPFGYIMDNCEGHFYRDKKCSEKVALAKVKPGEPLWYTAAHFEIVLSRAPEAAEFIEAVGGLAKKLGFVQVLGDRGHIEIDTVYNRRFFSLEPITKNEACKVREQNLQFIREFETLVDGFARKYWMGRRRGR